MLNRRSAVAALVGVALCAGLEVATWKPLPVQATVAPGIITTLAGGVGSGTAIDIAQTPWGIAATGTTVYIADFDHSVVRALDIGTGVETVAAGTGTQGDSGYGGLATAAQLNWPASVAVDVSGNLYIGSIGRVSRVDHSTGIITAVAGTGNGGNGGDGGAATSATVGWPEGLAVDASNNIYISDTPNNRIRRIDHATGVISNFAGGAFNGANGFGGDGGPATSALFTSPYGLATDATGNVFVADYGNSRIREISSGIINTVAGDGNPTFGGDGGLATSASLDQPRGVWVDASNNLWIADTWNERVREVDSGTGHISTVAGNGTIGSSGDGGPATSAQLTHPFSAIGDGLGHLFISDDLTKRVREISSGTINTVAGNGADCSRSGDGAPAVDATICAPVGVGVDGSGNVFISEQSDNVVREVSSDGTMSTLAGDGTPGASGDSGPATAAKLNDPLGVVADGSGNVYIADSQNNVVRKVTGGVISLFAGNYTAGLSGDGGPAISAQLSHPSGLAFDSAGNLYIADSSNFRIRKVTPGGVISTYAGSTHGNSGDGGPATSAQLATPQGVAIDGSGNLYISDTGNNDIRKVDVGGTISTVANILVRAIAAGPGNRLMVASEYTSQVSLVTPGGLVPLVGSGALGSAGDGGPATDAQLHDPVAVAVDAAGTIFVADYLDNRVRRVQAYQNPSAPTSVSASPGFFSAKVRWSAPATPGGLPINSYTVTPSSGSPVTVVGSPPALSATVSGLNPNSTYTFTVTAATRWGAGPASAPTNAVQPILVPSDQIATNAGSVGNGPATSLGQQPDVVAVAGNHLYVGDIANPVVRDVDLGSGNETALAGNDSYGYSGNGGPALSAMVNGAGAIAYCGPGNTYIADTYNYVIRHIDGAGHITTVAGTGRPGLSGDGGPGTSAQISRVLGLACRTGGGIYISDTDNGRVRILDGFGFIYTWWYGLRGPTGIVETGGQDLVDVSDSGHEEVLSLSDSKAVRIAGTGVSGSTGDGGPATSAKLNFPNGLAYEPSTHRLYIVDTYNAKIRTVVGGTISTLAGTGFYGFTDNVAATSAEFNWPTGIAMVPNVVINGLNILYVADENNMRVRKIDPSGGSPFVTTVAGNGTQNLSGNGGQATAAQLGDPRAVAFDGAGNEYVTDNQNNVIRKITPAGVISTVAGGGVPGFPGDGGPATHAWLISPQGVAANTAGDIFISDKGSGNIRRVDHATGVITTVCCNFPFLNMPSGIVVDPNGNLFVADTGNNRVAMITPAGAISTYAGTNGVAGFSGDGGQATAAELDGPNAVALDSAGNLAIADTLNNRVRLVAKGTGIITTVAGNGLFGLSGDLHAATAANLASPMGLAFDSSGDIYVADTANQRIRVVDSHGIINSLVGACGIVAAFSGDGGPADLAHVNTPIGLAIDGSGDVFIAEANSNRIRLASLEPAVQRGISCPAPAGSPGTRNVTGTLPGGPPGVRLPQHAPASWMPARSTSNTGTLTNPVRSAHVFPVRRSVQHAAPRPRTSASSTVVPRPAAAVTIRSAHLSDSTQPATSPQPISPWYAVLLVPFALLVVALVIQWRRQRE